MVSSFVLMSYFRASEIRLRLWIFNYRTWFFFLIRSLYPSLLPHENPQNFDNLQILFVIFILLICTLEWSLKWLLLTYHNWSWSYHLVTLCNANPRESLCFWWNNVDPSEWSFMLIFLKQAHANRLCLLIFNHRTWFFFLIRSLYPSLLPHENLKNFIYL